MHTALVFKDQPSSGRNNALYNKLAAKATLMVSILCLLSSPAFETQPITIATNCLFNYKSPLKYTVHTGVDAHFADRHSDKTGSKRCREVGGEMRSTPLLALWLNQARFSKSLSCVVVFSSLPERDIVDWSLISLTGQSELLPVFDNSDGGAEVGAFSY